MSTEIRPVGRQFGQLVHQKAWEHLGMTGTEFLAAWYDGRFKDDPRPAAQALDKLMRTGRWDTRNDLAAGVATVGRAVIELDHGDPPQAQTG